MRQYLSLLLITLLSTFQSLPVLADDFVPEGEDDMTTSANIFILDADNTGGDIELQFGDILSEYIKWNNVNTRFELSNSLDLLGNELINARMENLAVAPICDAANEGRIYQNTTDNHMYVCDSSIWIQVDGGSSGATTVDSVVGQFIDLAGGTDINTAIPTVVPFGAEVRKDTGVTHDNAINNSRVYLDEAGWHQASYNIAYLSGDNARKTLRCLLQLNGTTMVPGSESFSYSRNNVDKNGSNSATVAFETIGANEYYEIICNQAGTAGPVTLTANGSGTLIQKLDAGGTSSGGGIVPYLDMSQTYEMEPSTNKVFSFLGQYFTQSMLVTFPSFTGTVNSTTIVSPTQVDVDITSNATTGNYDIVLDNAGLLNTDWTGNGVGKLVVKALGGTGVAGTFTTDFTAGGVGDAAWGIDWILAVNSPVVSADTYFMTSSAGTTSSGTGPDVGINGNYVYIEASNPNNGAGASGEAVTTNFASIDQIDFDYHMFGANIDRLIVLSQNGDDSWTQRWIMTGQQQVAQTDPFLPATIDASAWNAKAVKFEFYSELGYAGDIAVDNIVITSS